MAKTKVPAVEGLFTMDPDAPHLIGARGRTGGSYFFPGHLAGSDPAGWQADDREDVLLSRTGTVWSYTSANYPPPAPYVVTSDPYQPFVLAAVELDEQKIVVLGQMVEGTSIDDVHIGMRVELCLAPLYEDDDNEYLVWKWRPLQEEPA